MNLIGAGYTIHQNDFLLTLRPAWISPVTISIPHDTLPSEELEGLVPQRVHGVKGRDIRVWPIVRDIATIAPVNIVRGFLPRSLCDLNRSYDEAFELDMVGTYWERYHWTIRMFLMQAERAGYCPLLLDFHGFTRQPPYGEFDVILATRNRTSITGEIDHRLGASLRANGFRTFVPQTSPQIPGREDLWDADYTVDAVKELGFNAMQIEVAAWLRSADSIEAGRRLSRAFASFITEEFSLNLQIGKDVLCYRPWVISPRPIKV